MRWNTCGILAEIPICEDSTDNDIRGKLGCHGLSRVRERHYDARDYMPKGWRALEALLAHLK